MFSVRKKLPWAQQPGNLKDAVILPTVGNTYGKTIDETGDTWDKDTLYYSNGKNSGIKLEVIRI